MKKSFIILILLYTHFNSTWAQGKEWHVRPYADNYVNSSGNDGSSFEKAWCLQFALTGAGGAIQPGDTVWLHGVQKSSYTGTTTAMVYKGHFTCNMNIVGPEVTIASYPGEWAIIDGNIRNSPTGPIPTANLNPAYFSPPNAPEAPDGSHVIFAVTSNNVHFHDFEVTCLGNFSRVHEARTIAPGENQPLCAIFHDYNFYEYAGINHTAGVNRFTNLVVRNIPGVAFGSWKFTADTEIYGNVLYNNGIIDVTGTSCAPVLTEVVNATLNLGNTSGHQASIYTQNTENGNKIRNIRNNIFHNCYDSGLIIWSANDFPSALDYVSNYSVTKNIFFNNGSPVRDETSNMLVSTDFNPIRNITIDSNIFYINSTSSYVSGILVKNANNVTIAHNYIVNGTAGMVFSGDDNHGINFNNNNYFGKRIQVFTSIGNFNGTSPIGVPWNFHDNHYFNKYLGSALPDMFLAPNSATSISLGTFQTNYTIANDTTVAEEFSDAIDYSTTLPSRYFITQNKENTNLFYVTIYNPAQTATSLVDFSPYNIPVNRVFKVRDVQNYFNLMNIGNNNMVPADSKISFPMNNTNFEMPLPIPHSNTSAFGPTYIAIPPAHTNSDINTFAIEFDCGLEYDRLVTGSTNSETAYVLRNNITFENYTSNTTATDVTARASRQILLKPNTHIKNDNRFLARIEVTCNQIPYDSNLANAVFDMGAGLNRVSNSGESDAMSKNNEFFTIYPNPSSGIFNIESLKSEKINHVVITKLNTTTTVFKEFFNNQKNVSIDISKEDIGLYAVQVFFEDNTSQTKTIIKK